MAATDSPSSLAPNPPRPPFTWTPIARIGAMRATPVSRALALRLRQAGEHEALVGARDPPHIGRDVLIDTGHTPVDDCIALIRAELG